MTHFCNTRGMDIQQWVNIVTDNASGRDIAAKLNMTASTVHRQLAKESPSPELIAGIARAYNASVLDGLIAVGLVTMSDLKDRVIVSTLADALDDELVAEIYRRLQNADSADGADVIDFPERVPHAADKSEITDEPDHP